MGKPQAIWMEDETVVAVENAKPKKLSKSQFLNLLIKVGLRHLAEVEGVWAEILMEGEKEKIKVKN